MIEPQIFPRQNGDYPYNRSQLGLYRAVKEVDREEIYRLRYQSYLHEGAIDRNLTGRFHDAHDEDSNALILGIALDDHLAASIRLHIVSPENSASPGLEVFPDVLGPMLDRGESFVDPTRFVIDRELRGASQQIPIVTVRLAAMAAEHFQADHMLATVRAEHVPFYKRYCHMELRSELRSYPGLKKPICVMSGACEVIRQTVFPKYPVFMSTEEERTALFGPPYFAANSGRRARARGQLKLVE